MSGTWQVRGRPTPAELAAVVAVLSAAAASAGSGEAADAGGTGTAGSSGWSAYWRAHRSPVGPGPGAWRASGWPR